MKRILIALLLMSGAARADIQPIKADSKDSIAKERAMERQPDWASWDYDTIQLSIDKADFDHKVYAFGVICTAGDICDEGVAVSMVAEKVKLTRRGDNVLAIPVAGSSHPPSMRPVLRFEVVLETETTVIVAPSMRTPFTVVEGSDPDAAATEVFDRFFHDFRQTDQGIWFHETINYAVEAAGTTSHQISTLSIYLIDDPASEAFAVKTAIKDVGFFTNVRTLKGVNLYNGVEPFNPSGQKAIRWPRGKTIEWVLDRRIPDAIYPLVASGITDWNQHLTNLTLTVRRAEEGEELDSPFKNVLLYTPYDTQAVGGYAGFTYDLATGEIFRGTVFLMGPKEITDKEEPFRFQPTMRRGLQYGEVELVRQLENFPMQGSLTDREQGVRGVTSHEIGHVLGLRHNFKGSLYVSEPQDYPGGSSVMEYVLNPQQMKIGPYDQQAVAWAYADAPINAETLPPFCTDELAGYFYLMAAHDPSCQRFDRNAAEHFNDFYARALWLLTEGIPSGVGIGTDGYTSMFLSLTLAYVRSASDPFFDQERSNLAASLLGRFASHMDLQTNGEALVTDVWTAAKLSLLPLINQKTAKRLDSRTLYNSAPFQSFIEWVASQAGGTAFALRKEISAALFALADDDAFGAEISRVYREHLSNAIASGQDAELVIENRFLLSNADGN